MSQFPPSDEESEEDEEESQSSNESQCASSESEADEKVSQCKLCNTRSYMEYLEMGLGVLWDSEEDYEAYQETEQDLLDLEREDLDFLEDEGFPRCTACFEHEVKRQREEKKASRYDSSE